MRHILRSAGCPLSGLPLVVAMFFLLFHSGAAIAHEYWLDLSDFTPEIGSEVEVRVSAGHYFPRSTFLLKEGVADGPVLTFPSGDTIHVSTDSDEKSRVGFIHIDSAGVHRITFSLSRLYAPAPYFEGKVLLIAGEGADDPAFYASGSGLELVPGTPISSLKQGDDLPVYLYLDGVRVTGSLTQMMENGKSGYFDIDEEGEIAVPLRSTGRHLLTASIQGRECSLVFVVVDAAE